jgi:AcrR family transcriptional regulator
MTTSSRNTREDVVRAAGRLFAQRGYHGTSMRDLGRELGLRGSSLYSHFPSKEALLVDVIRRASELFEASAAAAAEEAIDRGPVEQLAALIRGHIDVVLDHQDEARTFLNEAQVLVEDLRRPVVDVRDRYESAFRRVLEAGRAAGVFREDLDTPLAAILVLSMLNSLDRWYRPDGRLDRTVLAERLIQHTMQGILNGRHR